MNDPAAQPATSPSGHRQRLFALALFATLFGLYAATGSKLHFGYEGYTIGQTEALLQGNLPRHPGQGGYFPLTQGGLMDVAAYAPFAAAKLALEHRQQLPGFRQLIYVFAIPLYTALLLIVFYYLVLELYRRPGTAAALTIILGLGTMIWPYAKFGMETQQTLWTLAGLLLLTRYQHRPSARLAAGLGCTLAVLMLTKITGPLHAAALALAWVWAWLRQNPEHRRQPAAHLVIFAGLGLAGILAFLLTNHWRFGGWVFGGRYALGHETSPYPFLSGLWAACVSPGKSLFLFSPALVLGLWFWGEFWRRFPGIRAIVVMLLLIGLWHIHYRPWADETWGPRRLHYLVPVLVLPIGIWIERRAELRRWVRALGMGALALGAMVQIVAVAVDYSALAYVAGGTDLFAIENTVWQPQLSPIAFNLRMLRSAWHRRQTGESIPYAYELHYMPWTAPANPPGPRVFSVKGRDRLDLWVLQQRAEWSDRPYWFVSGSFYLWLGFVLLSLAGGVWIWWLGPDRSSHQENRPKPS